MTLMIAINRIFAHVGLWRWVSLIGLSWLLAGGLQAATVPAAFLLGPMMAAALLAVSHHTTSPSIRWFNAAQGLVGGMIANTLPTAVDTEMQRHWPLYVACIIGVLLVSSLLGWLLARWHILPGATAVWGTSPGAATVMTVMSQEFGADVRLVALMQYIRVVMVALVAIAVTRLSLPAEQVQVPSVQQASTNEWQLLPLIATLLFITSGVWLGLRSRIPAGAMLMPLLLMIAVRELGWFPIGLPQPILWASYAIVGWSIGARFDLPILRYAAKALPRLLLSTLVLILLCGLLAAILAHVTGMDPLTAYLAMSPGGADSVAIIGASSQVDMALVMTMQTGRLILVMVMGPLLARAVTSHLQRHLK
ncbi:AbrB family transcriptional regulator [Shewanella sp. A32]|uniref:AbrB family transcriptional regulator n=1 Tax=Shewanella sp. A32 TaxID=3031327 RepID=UPI0023B8BEF6|nr:AbrB family transcriptional regulator [Shewanella sp. A32]MDF0534178.1 AbrB family transcriptional regulator [Shewanella sp. A32]